MRRILPVAVAILVPTILAGFVRLPRLAQTERSALAERFRFERLPLRAGDSGDGWTVPSRTVRTVHPDLEHIAAWISSVGAAVALADLDGDGLDNDVCLVDPRTDSVSVLPAPGTAHRYEPFELDLRELPGVAQRSGPLSETTAPMGCLPGDLDEDGRLDLLVYFWGRGPVAYFARPVSAGLAAAGFRAMPLTADGERWYTNAAARADVDGDGHPDLVFGNYFQDGSGILDGEGGKPARMQESMSRAANGGGNRLLLWSPPTETGSLPRFEEVPDAFAGRVGRAWTLALGAADLDGDLLPELYFANDFGPDRLLHNRSVPGRPKFALVEGRRGLTTPASKILGRDSFKGMGVDFGDVNGDGLFDIYVSNIAAEYALEESHFLYLSRAGGFAERLARGIAPYRDASEELGLSRSSWAWEARFGDFDNDGRLEAVQATGFVRGSVDRWPELHELAMGNDWMLRFPGSWPRLREGDDLSGHEANGFFVAAADGRFWDVAPAVGLGGEQVTRGIATGDVDGDGDLDLAVANQWEPSYLYRNVQTGPGRSLVLDLRLPAGPAEGGCESEAPSRAAVGATARVLREGGKVLVGQVDGGSGHSGVRSPALHFGLGPPAGDSQGRPNVQVELAWRDRRGVPRSQRLRLPPGRHRLRLCRTALVEAAVRG